MSLLVCHTLAAYKRLFTSSSKFALVAHSASTLLAIPFVPESGAYPNIPREFPHEDHCPFASAAFSTSSQLERLTCSRPAHSSYAQSPEALPPVAAAASPAHSPVLRAGLLWPALAACCLFALFVPVAELEELQRQVALLTAQAKTGVQATAGAATGAAAASASGVRAALGAAMSALHVPPPEWLLVASESLDSLLVSLPVLWHACALPVAAKCAASFVLGAAAAVYFNRFLLVAWRT